MEVTLKKESKLASLQEQINKLIDEREKLKAS